MTLKQLEQWIYFYRPMKSFCSSIFCASKPQISIQLPSKKTIILHHHSYFIYVNLFTELCKNSHNPLAGWETNESHIPVLVPSPWDSQSGFPGLCSSVSAGNPETLALLRRWILALSSMVESCRQRFCYKKQHSGIAASVLGSQEQALRVCSPLPVRDAGFEGYPLLQGLRNPISHWNKQGKGTRKSWLMSGFEIVFSGSLFKIL